MSEDPCDVSLMSLNTVDGAFAQVSEGDGGELPPTHEPKAWDLGKIDTAAAAKASSTSSWFNPFSGRKKEQAQNATPVEAVAFAQVETVQVNDLQIEAVEDMQIEPVMVMTPLQQLATPIGIGGPSPAHTAILALEQESAPGYVPSPAHSRQSGLGLGLGALDPNERPGIGLSISPASHPRTHASSPGHALGSWDLQEPLVVMDSGRRNQSGAEDTPIQTFNQPVSP